MQIITKISELKQIVENQKKSGTLGFVPTMGALHDGHLELVCESLSIDNQTIVSIFVNPTQFNNKNDLKNYPRNTEEDCKKLKAIGCDFVFIPEDEDMYPTPDNRKFEFNGLDSIMEGKHRPGHFNGVAQIVTKLFDMVMPDRAYFGEKDYQQLAIIKRLVQIMNYPIEIVAVPTVREKDGLAMSSRNQLLKHNYREAAPIIYKSLSSIKELMANNSPDEIRKYMEEEFLNNDLLEMEYFELVNSSTLQPIRDWSQNSSITACIAVQAGQVRLIDNITIN